jgi:hypothetical protein
VPNSCIINGHRVHIEVTGDDEQGWLWWYTIDGGMPRRADGRLLPMRELAWSKAADEAEAACNSMPKGDAQ